MRQRKAFTPRADGTKTPLADLEAAARNIGHQVGGLVPDGACFFLILSNVGADGSMTYVSNANRLDSIKLLRELALKLEGS